MHAFDVNSVSISDFLQVWDYPTYATKTKTRQGNGFLMQFLLLLIFCIVFCVCVGLFIYLCLICSEIFAILLLYSHANTGRRGRVCVCVGIPAKWIAARNALCEIPLLQCMHDFASSIDCNSHSLHQFSPNVFVCLEKIQSHGCFSLCSFFSFFGFKLLVLLNFFFVRLTSKENSLCVPNQFITKFFPL